MWKKNEQNLAEARPKTKDEILAEAFRPGVVGASGGRPAYSILQLYRCFTLPLVTGHTAILIVLFCYTYVISTGYYYFEMIFFSDNLSDSDYDTEFYHIL